MIFTHLSEIFILKMKYLCCFRTLFATMKGSPLEGPLGRTLSRLLAAGILPRWLGKCNKSLSRVAEFSEPPRLPRASRTKEPTPLGWLQLRPAFVVLASGLAAASVAFSLELAGRFRTVIGFIRGVRHTTAARAADLQQN